VSSVLSGKPQFNHEDTENTEMRAILRKEDECCAESQYYERRIVAPFYLERSERAATR